MKKAPYRKIQRDVSQPSCWDRENGKDRNMSDRQDKRANQLFYNGTLIRDQGEMLNLTDMWKAAGTPVSRRPSHWLQFPETIEFVAEVSKKVRREYILSVTRGRHGSTFAHWQIGLAYAQYLSPEFHMWCNTVVREKMMAMAVTTPSDEVVNETRRAGLSLTEGDLHVIGSIVKDVMEKRYQTYRERLYADRVEHEERIKALVDERIAQALPKPQVEMVSTPQILSAYGFPRGTRGDIGAHLCRGLKERAEFLKRHGGPVVATQEPHSNLWLFEKNFADEFVRDVAKPMLDAHRNKARSGQGVIAFPLVPQKVR